MKTEKQQSFEVCLGRIEMTSRLGTVCVKGKPLEDISVTGCFKKMFVHSSPCGGQLASQGGQNHTGVALDSFSARFRSPRGEMRRAPPLL